jgi:hypothetical protein
MTPSSQGNARTFLQSPRLGLKEVPCDFFILRSHSTFIVRSKTFFLFILEFAKMFARIDNLTIKYSEPSTNIKPRVV